FGRLSKKRTRGSSPPADAPMPTTKFGRATSLSVNAGVGGLCSPRGSSSYDISLHLARTVSQRAPLTQTVCPHEVAGPDGLSSYGWRRQGVTAIAESRWNCIPLTAQ